jgi:hypothetical protein
VIAIACALPPASARGRGEHALPDLLRIVLDPARAREVLRELCVSARADVELVVDEQTRRPGRPLVDCKDHCGESYTFVIRTFLAWSA